MKIISLGCDHAGYALKESIKSFLLHNGYQINDCGAFDDSASDYPDFCRPAAESVVNGESDGGIVIGGSGNGEAMVANKVKGIRCGVCWNSESARLAKQHNNANMIALGARMVDNVAAMRIIQIWLEESFEGGRHLKRINSIEK